jgi:hypothetical protein
MLKNLPPPHPPVHMNVSSMLGTWALGEDGGAHGRGERREELMGMGRRHECWEKENTWRGVRAVGEVPIGLQPNKIVIYKNFRSRVL